MHSFEMPDIELCLHIAGFIVSICEPSSSLCLSVLRNGTMLRTHHTGASREVARPHHVRGDRHATSRAAESKIERWIESRHVSVVHESDFHC